jgi:hypothetical protein
LPLKEAEGTPPFVESTSKLGNEGGVPLLGRISRLDGSTCCCNTAVNKAMYFTILGIGNVWNVLVDVNDDDDDEIRTTERPLRSNQWPLRSTQIVGPPPSSFTLPPSHIVYLVG